MALTLKQVGTGKTWTTKKEDKKTGAGAVFAAPAQWTSGGLTLKKKAASIAQPPAAGPVSQVSQQVGTKTLPYEDELKRLESKKQELTVGLDLDGAAAVQEQINALKRKNGTSFLQRVGNTLSGAGKQTAAAYSDAAATMYETGQKHRDNQNDFFLKEYQRQYDDAERDYRFMLEDNEAEPGTWSQSDIETALNRMSAAKTKMGAMGVVVNEKVQERAATAARDFNQRLSESGAKDTEKAKEGLGSVGRFAVDAATGLAQLGGDIAAGVATGGGATVPLMLRSFGGGTMKARQEGARLNEQLAYGGLTALTELLTEKIGSVGRIQTKAFGKGGLDDIFEGVVAAAERAGKTPAGRAALNRLASAGTGFLSEGLEGAVSAAVEPVIAKLTYGKELPDIKQLAQDVAYDFLVGGAIGAVTGGTGGTDTTKAQWRTHDQAIDQRYASMGEKGMFGATPMSAAGQKAGDIAREQTQDQIRKEMKLANRQGGEKENAASGVETAGVYSENYPQNVERPTVPLIELSVKQYADDNGNVPNKGNGLRNDAINRARVRLGLDQNEAAYIPASNVVRNGEEYVLKITKASLNKMLSTVEGAALPVESIAVMDNLERIANNGVWKRGEGDRKKRQQIKGVDHLVTTVYIDGAPHVVDMRVRLVQEAPGKATDNVLYYFTPEEIVSIEKVDTSSPTAQRRALRILFGESASTEEIVSDTKPVVNTASDGGTNADPADTIPDSDVVLPVVPSNDPKVLNQWKRAVKMANNFGCELRCAIPEGGGMGSYLNGVITVHPDCTDPVRQVLLHELTHRLEASRLYGRLTLFARRWLDAHEVDVDGRIQEIIREREVQGHSLSERGAMQEVVAQFVQEHLFRDERSIQRLLREDRTLFQKIRNWLQDAVRWVRKVGGLFNDIYRAERLFEKALRTSEPKMGMSVAQLMSEPTENTPVQIGENAETAPNEEREPNYPERYDSMADVQEGDYRPLPTAEEIENAGDPVESLPTKAKNYLKGVERKLVGQIGNILSVPKRAGREFIEPVVRYISEEFLNTGTVNQQALDSLFNRAYEAGIIVERDYYDQYKFVRDHLLHTPLTLSEVDRSDIADFDQFRKSAFGLIKLKNEGGLPVDVAYMELQRMAPELFPTSITHPADQLVHMHEVARDIEIVEKSLDDYYGEDAETFKVWAKRDFEAAVADTLAELRIVERYAQEQTRKKAAKLAASADEVRKAYSEIRGARKMKEKVVAKHLLTDYDNGQVARLLKGEIELEDLDPTKCNVKGIKAVFEASQEYERLARVIREYNRLRKAKLYEQADELLETANDWKDKGAGFLYSRETMERNIRDIVPDKDVARQVVNTYFAPVHEAQAQSTRFKNRYRERVKGLNLSRKVAEGNEVSEAYAVQLVGEVMDNIRVLQESKGRLKSRDGKSLRDWQSIIGDLWAKNPNLDRTKIEGAVAEFRAIYDELFQQMNEVRLRNGYEPVAYRQGYFPHFQTTGEGGMLAAFGKALGIDTSVSALPTTINGLTHTFRPGITWFGNAQERLGVNTAYDAVEGFDKYIEGAADVIHHTDNLQRLRTLASRIRYKTSNDGIREQIDAVDSRTDINEQEKKALKEDIYKNAKFTLSRFVVELEEYTNLLANKKSIHDRNAEHDFGRKIYKVVKGLSSRVAANMVAINPTSWLTNFIPITQAWGVVDSKDILRAMWDTLHSYKADDGLVERSAFLTNRRGSDPLVRTWSQEASAKLTKPMDWIDTFTSDVVVRARYLQNLRRGLSEAEALAEADAFAAGVIADRSKGATPTLFQRSNPTTKLLTQFQLEVNNQFSYLAKDIPDEMKEKAFGVLAAALLKFFLGAFLYNEVYEFFIGRRPALDPIGILNDTVGDLSGWELPNLVELGAGAVTGDLPSFETEKKGVYQSGLDLAGNLAEEVPFVGGLLGGGRIPVSSALPDAAKLWGAATNANWNWKKRLETALKEIGKPAVYTLPPFGGGQLKKGVEGLGAIIQGGSYTVDNAGRAQLQYPIYNDTLGDVLFGGAQAITFGKSANRSAQKWVDDGFDTYKHKQTAVYRQMNDAGVSDREAHALLEALESAPTKLDKKRTLLKADITERGKKIAYFGLLAGSGEDAIAKKRKKVNGALASGLDFDDWLRFEVKSAGKKKAEVLDIINGMRIPWEQKDALFLTEYTESTLDDAPWYMERWTLPAP